MLLVDHDEPQPAERDALLHQRVSADRQPGLPRRESRPDRGLFAGGLSAQQQLGADLQRSEQMLERGGVLLGEELRGRHERRLEIVLHRQQHREERDDGLPGPDVTHQQPVHPLGRGHVPGDLSQRALLVRGQLPRQVLTQPGGQVALDLEGDPAPLAFRDSAGANQHELEIEQLVEGQSPPASLGVLRRSGAMDRAERFGEGEKPGSHAHRLGQHVLGGRDQRVEMPLDEPANDLVAQALGGGIYGQHFSGGQGIGVGSCVREDDEFAGCQLPAVIEPDRARDQQRLADLDAPVQERLPRPDTLEYSAIVSEHGVEDPETLPGGQHTLRDHSPDARHFLPDFSLHQGGDARRVHVPVRQVPQEIARRPDPQPLELLRPTLADPLQELYGRVEP